MNRDADDELHGIGEEVSEDLGYPPEGENDWRRRAASHKRPMSRGLFMLVGGVGILLLIILFTLILSGEKGGKADERVSALKARVDQIENKLAGMAGFEERLAQAEKQAKLAQQSMAGAERQFSILEGRSRTCPKRSRPPRRKRALRLRRPSPRKKNSRSRQPRRLKRPTSSRPAKPFTRSAKSTGYRSKNCAGSIS
jgi:hypothetical protein